MIEVEFYRLVILYNADSRICATHLDTMDDSQGFSGSPSI